MTHDDHHHVTTKGYNKCSTISKKNLNKKQPKKLAKIGKHLAKTNGDGKTTKNLMMTMAI